MKNNFMKLLRIAFMSLFQFQYVAANIPVPQSGVVIDQSVADGTLPPTGVASEKPVAIPSSQPPETKPSLVKDVLTIAVSETDAEKIAKVMEMVQRYWKEYKTPAVSPLPATVEYEMATLVAENLSALTPEKYAELLKKYNIAQIDASPEVIKEKLIKDVEFRKEMAERISCVLYPVFRSFGWQSESDDREYDSVQRYRDRLQIHRMIPLPAPLAEYSDKFKKVVLYSFFNEKGIIRLQDGGELIQADFTAGVGTAKFLRDLFPHSWSNILVDSKMTQLGYVLSQMHDVTWETDYGKDTWFELAFKKNSARLHLIHEKEEFNKSLINVQFRQDERINQEIKLAAKVKKLKDVLKPYVLDPLFRYFSSMKNRERALEKLQQRAQRMHEFAQKFGLKEVKDPILAKLMYELSEQHLKSTDSSKNLITNIKMLTDKNAQYHIASNSSIGVEKKLYDALFDSHGVYKLVLQPDQFVENLHLSSAISRVQYVSIRRYLNLFVVLRNQKMDTRYQPFIEEGLKIITQALEAKGRALKRYEEQFEMLYKAIKGHRFTQARCVLKGFNRI